MKCVPRLLLVAAVAATFGASQSALAANGSPPSADKAPTALDTADRVARHDKIIWGD
jgi:hypothetical protein